MQNAAGEGGALPKVELLGHSKACLAITMADGRRIVYRFQHWESDGRLLRRGDVARATGVAAEQLEILENEARVNATPFARMTRANREELRERRSQYPRGALAIYDGVLVRVKSAAKWEFCVFDETSEDDKEFLDPIWGPRIRIKYGSHIASVSAEAMESVDIADGGRSLLLALNDIVCTYQTKTTEGFLTRLNSLMASARASLHNAGIEAFFT
jgi:hypothetical protein